MQSQKVEYTAQTAIIGSGIATALEWMPLGFGVITSLMGIYVSVRMLKNNNERHKLKIMILRLDYQEKKERNGKKTSEYD